MTERKGREVRIHLLDQRFVGIALLVLLTALVAAKRRGSGSLVEKPSGGPLLRVVNCYNLFFLLVLNPVIAIALVLRRLHAIDPAPIGIGSPRTAGIVEIVGLAPIAAGYGLMAWALVVLGRNYQLGGLAPRPGDTMVVTGPYRWIRHPMYAAALCIAIGLACIVQSWVLVAVFLAYLVLVLMLIPAEEAALRAAYGGSYGSLEARTKRLIPFVF